VIGGVRSAAQACALAAVYTPVTHGGGFAARALQAAGVPGAHLAQSERRSRGKKSYACEPPIGEAVRSSAAIAHRTWIA
jgi:hypothetical protein